MSLASPGTCSTIDTETRLPQTQPLKTLQEVLSWKASKEASLFANYYSSSKTFQRPTEPRTKPYTLVCHDYKGGYLEDRYIQGGAKKDAYYFCRWECIDIFVYFSHHFVTVPPVGWVRAAHKHGTMILGTIITEWTDGADLWSEVLSSRATVQQLVSQLVDICQHYGFDGWLVNVENKIQEDQVGELKVFVELLTQACHTRLPGSKVLWYDSVTRTGELLWQDQLNQENSQFFDACDGIFLNYCWTPEKLASSRDLAVEKLRPFDVFVGIDVFGRGCPGGGGFNTREALEHARRYNLSAAIFAPGWVLEDLGATDFDNNDCKFWAKLHDLCQTEPSSLPLSSAFCQGHGNAFFCSGKDISGKPWYNMSLQQRQPDRCQVYGLRDPASLACRPSLNTCLTAAYLGGCSVELSAHLTRPLQRASFRLFSVRAKLDEALYCSLTYKQNSAVPCHVYMVLTFGSGMLTRSAIMGTNDELDRPDFRESDGEPAAKKKKLATEDLHAEDLHVKPLSEQELEQHQGSPWFHHTQQGEGGQEQGEGAWETRHFRVDTSRLRRQDSPSEEESVSISVCLMAPATGQCQDQDIASGDVHQQSDRASVLLGHLQVFREQDLTLKAPTVSDITLDKLDVEDLFPSTNDPKSSKNGTESSSSSKTAASPSYLIGWAVSDSGAVDYFNVYLGKGGREGAPSLVGHTAGASFVTSVPPQCVEDGSVTVTVQPVLAATGLPLPLPSCASHTLPLPSSCPAP